MFRKLTLALAAIGTLGLGSAALAPSTANAGSNFSFSIDVGHPGHYRPYHHRSRWRHYRPVREVCKVKQVRKIGRRGRVVYKEVTTCRPARRRWR